MSLSFYEIAAVIGAKNNYHDFPDGVISQVEFDSRNIKPGDLFIPLKGNRDGHEFIETAFANGALATLSEKPVVGPHLLVDDVLTAFQTLASYVLKKKKIDVIAVTGSNGKTTTKDMIHDILATTYKTYKTQGNYNNEIGLPYTVLHMPEDTEKIVLEMGQDHFGDIHLLSMIARPCISVITLVGEAHLAFFKSREEIAQGKLQIADGMADGSLLVVPNDPILEPYLPENMEVIAFGEGTDLSVMTLKEDKKSLSFKTSVLDGEIFLPVPGRYNATNAMIAAYVAKRCGVSDDAIKSALASLELTKNRTEWRTAFNGAEMLSDVYNANPTAMRLILETFSAIPKNPKGRKIVVLADMKELGESSAEMHAQMASSLVDNLDVIYLYGPEMAALAAVMENDQRVHYVKSTEEFDQLLACIRKDLQAEDQLLLKGSNSMNLAKIVENLEACHA